MYIYTTCSESTRRDRRGFALPATILLIFMLTSLALFGVVLARNEQQMFVRGGSRMDAFYGAEAGMARAIENWAGADAATTPPGDTRLLSEGTLPGGVSYRAAVTRLDDGSTVHPLFAMRARGEAPNGEREFVGLLVTSVPLEIPIKSAMRVRGQTRIKGNAVVDGNDHVPPDLDSECPPPDTARPGIITNDTDNLDIGGSVDVDGNPPIFEDPDASDENFFDFGGMTFDELKAKANINLPGGTTISSQRPSPSLNADGSCNTTDPYNWGDPENLHQPCSSWFPIVYAEGNLKLSGGGAGQMILLVEGDLEMTGGVELYGPVIVKGKVKSTGTGFHIHGGLVAGDTDINDESFLGGNSAVGFSTCSLRRAVSHSDVSSPRALTERAWYQTR